MNAPLDMHRNLWGTRWTSEMDETLRRERDGGKSFSEAVAVINKLFGTSLTRNAATGRASRLQMPGRKQPPPKPKAPPRPKPATRTVIRPVPVVSAKTGSVSYRMKPKTMLVDDTVERTPIEIGSAAVTFFDVRSCHCRWPYGDPRDLETFRFCGEAAPDDRPYCAGHTRQAKGFQL